METDFGPTGNPANLDQGGINVTSLPASGAPVVFDVEATEKMLRQREIELAKRKERRTLTISPSTQRAEKERVDALYREGISMVRALINEKLLKVALLKAQGINWETIPEIIVQYEYIRHIVREHHVEPDALLEYACFLEEQGDYGRARAEAQWLEAYYALYPPDEEESITDVRNLIKRCDAAIAEARRRLDGKMEEMDMTLVDCLSQVLRELIKARKGVERALRELEDWKAGGEPR